MSSIIIGRSARILGGEKYNYYSSFRDPLERLVSAYRDKIHGALPGTLHDKLRRRITRDYRGVPVPKTRSLPEKFIPTFREFVEYLVVEFSKGKVPDMHWAPVYSFCHPCQVVKAEAQYLQLYNTFMYTGTKLSIIASNIFLGQSQFNSKV